MWDGVLTALFEQQWEKQAATQSVINTELNLQYEQVFIFMYI